MFSKLTEDVAHQVVTSSRLLAAQMATAVANEPRLNAEELFDSVGPGYEKAFEGLPTQVASIRWLLDQLAPQKPARTLDIGCGTGRPVCSALVDAGHGVLGIDISSAMIAAAKSNVPKANFEKMDIADFKAASESFDAITVYFSLIANVTQNQIRQYIKKVFDWLKPGGCFVFATVPIDGENLEIMWMGRPITASSIDPDDAANCIKQTGFDIVHNEVTKFMPKSAEVGLCKPEDVWEEPHLFVFAKKP